MVHTCTHKWPYAGSVAEILYSFSGTCTDELIKIGKRRARHFCIQVDIDLYAYVNVITYKSFI